MLKHAPILFLTAAAVLVGVFFFQVVQPFVNACRGMLVGTILAAALQAICNGVGFAVAGIEGALLLAFCTFFVSMAPYLGAAAVWLPVVVFLLFEQRWLAAVLLATYGTFVVSSVDNLIRAHAMHGHAHIHPLVALISILGAIRLLGLWGIIVGPVTAVLFYALLELVNKKIDEARQTEKREAGGRIIAPADP